MDLKKLSEWPYFVTYYLGDKERTKMDAKTDGVVHSLLGINCICIFNCYNETRIFYYLPVTDIKMITKLSDFLSED